MKIIIDHIALVVKSVDKSILKLKNLNFTIGDVHEFPSEGTKEVYISKGQEYGKLLLMEPISDGPYENALQKRGVGLHHIAVNVQSIGKYLETLNGSGWYLHMHSYKSLKYKTVWLARANTPLLIEVHEISKMPNVADSELFISKVELNSNINDELLNSLQIKDITKLNSSEMTFQIENKAYKLSELI